MIRHFCDNESPLPIIGLLVHSKTQERKYYQ